jgi:hypothetical protein
MSNEREFSIVRRRKNLVDLITPRVAGLSAYQFEVATNFDAAYTLIITAPIASGFADPNISMQRLRTFSPLPGNNKVRVVFDPASFAPAPLPNGDDAHFWIRMIPVDAVIGPLTPTPGVMVMTEDERQAQQQIILAGTAPAIAAPGLQVDLPRRVGDLKIRNNEAAGGTDLMVATTLNGPEFRIEPQVDWTPYQGLTPTLHVRGDGGTAAFSASFSTSISPYL